MALPDGKRRLPVLPSSEDDGERARPAWQWSAIGAVTIVIAWIPLAVAVVRGFAVWSASTTNTAGLALAAAHAAAFALASIAGGALVGRFGGGASKRAAFAAGQTVAWGATAITILTGGFHGVMAVGSGILVASLAAASAWAGERIGTRARPR